MCNTHTNTSENYTWLNSRQPSNRAQKTLYLLNGELN